MPLTWLSLAILCTVGYHLVLKVTPAGVNPLLSLLVTYAMVTVLFGLLLLASPGGGKQSSDPQEGLMLDKNRMRQHPMRS